MARILLIDNDKDLRRKLANRLQEAGHEVQEAEDGSDALERLKQHSFSLIITELLLTDVDGMAVINYLDGIPHHPPIIAISGGNDQIPAEMALLMIKPQVAATLEKPFDESKLLGLVNSLLTVAAAP